MFETELVFAGKPDEDQSLLAPLPPDLAPGLYFLAAAPQGKEADNPALFAGQWFIVSDVRAGAALTGGGAEVFVANQKGHFGILLCLGLDLLDVTKSGLGLHTGFLLEGINQLKHWLAITAHGGDQYRVCRHNGQAD